MSNDQKPSPSTLTCALVALGGAVVVGGGLAWLASRQTDASRMARIDQLMQRFDPWRLTKAEGEELQDLLRWQSGKSNPSMFGALQDATGELEPSLKELASAAHELSVKAMASGLAEDHRAAEKAHMLASLKADDEGLGYQSEFHDRNASQHRRMSRGT